MTIYKIDTKTIKVNHDSKPLNFNIITNNNSDEEDLSYLEALIEKSMSRGMLSVA